MMQRNTFRKNTFDLSPEIHHIAKQEELGELCEVYPVSKHNTTISRIGKLCLFLAAFVAVFDLFLYGEAVLSRLAFAILAFILLMVGLYTILSNRVYARWHIYLWQNGFIYEKKQIRQAFRWNQIESVQADVDHIGNGIVYSCKVCRQDGYELAIGNVFLNLPEFIDYMLEESARYIGPTELNVTSPKNTWTLTHTKLDRQGISNGQETLPWQKIQGFMTKNGTVTLRKKEGNALS